MEFPTIDKFAKEVAEKALDEITYEGKTIREWAEIITKQQPCDDCISREEVIDLVADYDLNMDQVVKGIHALPSITPQPKVGEWIDCYKEMPIFNAGGFTETKHVGWTCSCCKENNFWIKSDYCPNCGAKMEGEDKNESDSM